MRKRILLVFFSLVILLIYPAYQHFTTKTYDIVIFGGGPAGCAAARSAAWTAPDKQVLLIVPEPRAELGGLATIGGQNFADIRYWQGDLVTKGSFQRWFEQSGQFYSTAQLAENIKNDLAQFVNLTILYQHDISKVHKRGEVIKTLSLSPVCRNEQGVVQWGKGKHKVRGTIYIDASDDGRLIRLSGGTLTVGRQDWPVAYLSAEESTGAWARQQAATLMFKVKDVKKPEKPCTVGDLNFVVDQKGSWGLVGGKSTWQNDAVVKNFNKQYAASGFALKPLNAAQDGAGSDEWWVNMLLVFEVDGRAHERDRGTVFFPEIGSGQRTVDEAWCAAREVLKQPEFLEALRRFQVVEQGQMYGFGAVNLVWDEQQNPVVGEIMYLRETVHTPLRQTGSLRQRNPEQVSREQPNNMQGNSNTAEVFSWDENADFALTRQEVQQAGSGIQDGKDRHNYAERIGLGYYMMDINAFMAKDLQQEDAYVWPVTDFLRPDWQAEGGQPTNPVYLPFAMLQSHELKNLLIPGNATGCASFAWAEIRVLPNLTVLGDAAGVAAARTVLFGEQPADFAAEQLRWVQEQLTVLGARLEK